MYRYHEYTCLYTSRDLGEDGGQANACLSITSVHHLANMAIALGRFMRFIRSIFVPTAAIVGFSCLLTFFFVLYQPTRGPGDIQRLGWQSWDVISPLSAENGSAGHETWEPPPTSGDHDAAVDWWNVTGPPSSSPSDSASLPLDVWAPLLPHVTGRMLLFLFFCSVFELNIYINSIRDRRRSMHV
jgi:hypothetical protein